MESIFWYTDITKERSNHRDLETHWHKLRARAYHHQQLLGWRANDPGNDKTVLSDFLARHQTAHGYSPTFLFLIPIVLVASSSSDEIQIRAAPAASDIPVYPEYSISPRYIVLWLVKIR